MRVVVLLRGVNVGGVRFAMTDLAVALEQDGLRDVRTVLASGNVVATTDDGTAQATADRVSAVIAKRFGFVVGAIGASGAVVHRAVDGYPFERVGGRHAYVVFGERPEALDQLRAIAADLDPAVERVLPGEGVLYWDAPKGETLTTAFGKRFGRAQRGGTVTTRNVNTLEKILAVL